MTTPIHDDVEPRLLEYATARRRYGDVSFAITLTFAVVFAIIASWCLLIPDELNRDQTQTIPAGVLCAGLTVFCIVLAIRFRNRPPRGRPPRVIRDD